jgi:hypothetical protein
MVDKILNGINEVGQFCACRIRVPAGNSVKSGIQFTDQALLL